MAHFSYVRPGGNWYGGVPVLHGELTQLDQDHFKAINGDDGSTHAPLGIITIGGAGLNVTTNFFSSGFCTIRGHAEIGSAPSDSLAVYATSTFNAPSSFTGLTTTTLTASGASSFAGIGVSGSAVFAGGASFALGVTFTTASFSNLATFSNGVSVSGASAFQAVSTFGTLNVAGGATITTAAVCSGAGRLIRPAVIGAASGGGTASPVTANEYYFPSVTADETYTISDTGAVDGDWIEFWTNSATNTVFVNDPFGTLIQQIKNASGNYVWLKAKRIAGTWRLVGLTKA